MGIYHTSLALNIKMGWWGMGKINELAYCNALFIFVLCSGTSAAHAALPSPKFWVCQNARSKSGSRIIAWSRKRFRQRWKFWMTVLKLKRRFQNSLKFQITIPVFLPATSTGHTISLQITAASRVCFIVFFYMPCQKFNNLNVGYKYLSPVSLTIKLFTAEINYVM